jgi:pimeloyl-ACP methyl ester carboxylesterase
VYRLPSLLKLLAMFVFFVSVSPMQAQEREHVIQGTDFYVTTSGVSIHVHRKVGDEPNKVPILLIHGSWGNAQTWDFPGRSVMDYLAVRGYDVYALDLRGEGSSGPFPRDYSQIDVVNRVSDAASVAYYIFTNTGRAPVVIGWSQGGVIAGILAANPSTAPLVAGVGLFSVAPAGFTVPPQFVPLLPQLFAGPSVFLMEFEINALVFGTDPVTGKSTMSPDAEDTFYAISAPDIDSTFAIEESASPLFFAAALPSGWGQIRVPALVVDGALDPLVGGALAGQLFGALTGTTNKQLIVFPRNSHAWFLEDNYKETQGVFDHFLSQFSGREPGERSEVSEMLGDGVRSH